MRNTPGSVAVPLCLILGGLVGVLVTAGNLGYIHANWGNVWPIWIIAMGVGMLMKGGQWAGPVRLRDPGAHFRTRFASGTIHENVVFSSLNRRVESPNFEGA